MKWKPPVFSDVPLACSLLRKGGVLAFPTETVYGLGALLSQEGACQRIYTIKKRPKNKPLMFHVSVNQDLEEFVATIPMQARLLINHFWPGPLALVLPKSIKWTHSLFLDQENIGFRCPSLLVAQDLLQRLQEPILATSANLSGAVAKVVSAEVIQEIGDQIDGVLSFKERLLGIASTIIDFCDASFPRVIREGAIPLPQIEAIVGPVER